MLQLAGRVTGRSPSYLTGEELSNLMRWKLAKGKFRPRLQMFADSLACADVQRVSAAAFQQLGKPGATPSGAAAASALSTITQFKGVGPATGSAVLSLYSPHVPFMGDEALEACLPKREYTPAAFKAYLAHTSQWARDLSTQEHEQGIQHDMQLHQVTRVQQLAQCCWSPQLLQLALYARASASKLTGKQDPQAAREALEAMPLATEAKPVKGSKRPRSSSSAAPAPAAAAAAAAAAGGGDEPLAAGAQPSARAMRARRR